MPSSVISRFIPQSGCDLEPNVAARRLRWVSAYEDDANPLIEVEDWNSMHSISPRRKHGLELTCSEVLKDSWDRTNHVVLELLPIGWRDLSFAFMTGKLNDASQTF
jgi:hypothetical protein